MNTLLSNEFDRRVIFNWAPVEYMDASWVSPWLSSDAISAIRKVPEACCTLNHFLLEELGFTDSVDDETFLNETLRLLLFSELDVTRFALYLGLTLHNDVIRNILCGTRQGEIKKRIGEEGYQFSIKRAPFIVGRNNDYLSDTQYANLEFTSDAQGIHDRCFYTGIMLVARAIRNLSDSTKRRVCLLFPLDKENILTQEWVVERGGSVQQEDQSSELDNKIGILFRKIYQEIN